MNQLIITSNQSLKEKEELIKQYDYVFRPNHFTPGAGMGDVCSCQIIGANDVRKVSGAEVIDLTNPEDRQRYLTPALWDLVEETIGQRIRETLYRYQERGNWYKLSTGITAVFIALGRFGKVDVAGFYPGGYVNGFSGQTNKAQTPQHNFEFEQEVIKRLKEKGLIENVF